MRSRVMLGTVALVGFVLAAFFLSASAADDPKKDPEPPVIDPGPVGGPPSDATVLFDGKDLSKLRGERSPEPKWKLENGFMETTPQGGVFSKQEFADCQLHVEWAAPSAVKGEGQGRGNSGVYLMDRSICRITATPSGIGTCGFDRCDRFGRLTPERV